MTRRIGTILLGLLLVGVLAYGSYQIMELSNSRRQMTVDMASLQNRVNQLESRLRRTQEKVRELENASMKGVVEDANKAIIDGWSAMIGALEHELQKARRNLSNKDGSGGAPQGGPPSKGGGDTGGADTPE